MRYYYFCLKCAPKKTLVFLCRNIAAQKLKVEPKDKEIICNSPLEVRIIVRKSLDEEVKSHK